MQFLVYYIKKKIKRAGRYVGLIYLYHISATVSLKLIYASEKDDNLIQNSLFYIILL